MFDELILCLHNKLPLKFNERLLRTDSIRKGLKRWRLLKRVKTRMYGHSRTLVRLIYLISRRSISALGKSPPGFRVHQTASGSRNRAERRGDRGPPLSPLADPNRDHRVRAKGGISSRRLGGGIPVGSSILPILPHVVRLDRSRLIYPHDRFPPRSTVLASFAFTSLTLVENTTSDLPIDHHQCHGWRRIPKL